MREVEVMSTIKHDNLAQLLSYCNEGNERILVYEYMKNKSLNLYIFAGTYYYEFIILIVLIVCVCVCVCV
jgi:serine/threonine protein kinase